MAATDSLLITCEHGGNRIPPSYRHFFVGHDALLASHRGFDPGALAMARDLASMLHAPLHFSAISRLLIDLNRSLRHPKLYSEVMRNAPAAVRREILMRYYLPYRQRIEAEIAAKVAQDYRVIHLSSHSFTPVLDGEMRNADIGLLYDPSRSGEAELCRYWQRSLATLASDLRVRRNYPYTGKSDGFTAYLRRRFPAEVYIGIELEINQGYVTKGGQHWHAKRTLVARALQQALLAYRAPI
jgi:predicted N-formylglutamate amidohydrolase